MKSNEEFIAGIYEKAAVYAETKKENKETIVSGMPVKRHAQRMSALSVAAMLAVCVGLLGVGALTLGRGTNEDAPNQGNEGIMQLSDNTEEETPGISAAQFRGIPEAETGMLRGTVESVDREEGVIWVVPEPEDGSREETRIAAVKWDTTEEMPAGLTDGTRLVAEGITGTYSGADASRSGSMQLKLADISKLWMWDEETDTYKNCNNEERK